MVLVAKPFLGLAEFGMELGQMLTGEVLEFHSFEVVPDAFVGIHLRSIGGQSLQLEPRGCAGSQKVLDHVAAMDGSSVPEYQELSLEVAVQVAEEPDHLRASERGLLHLHVQLSLGCDPTDSGEVIVGPPLPQHWGLPTRGEGPYHGGQQVEARFVYEDDSASLLLGFF